MDVRAVVVIGDHSDGNSQSPYALADVLGKAVVFRVVEQLQSRDIHDVTVITDVACEKWPTGTAAHGSWIHAPGEQLWKSIEHTFDALVQNGAEIVLVLRLGTYTELDYHNLLRFHVARHPHITSVVDSHGVPLGIYAISASRRNHAAQLFRHRFQQLRCTCEHFLFDGYTNHLSSPNHLRQLAIEGLMQRIQLRPEGEQVKPGVWIGRGAQVHKRARVLGPSFIGAGSRVRAAAVVTRCTALEHHTVVDCGTVVENTTTLPYTYLGAGLDVTHSVVGHSKLYNLKRGVEVEFSDPRLVGQASSRAPLRAAGSLLALASFFPAQLLRGLFASSQRECPASLPEAIATPAAALESTAPIKAKTAPAVDAGEFPANLVIARRYGNE